MHIGTIPFKGKRFHFHVINLFIYVKYIQTFSELIPSSQKNSSVGACPYLVVPDNGPGEQLEQEAHHQHHKEHHREHQTKH